MNDKLKDIDVDAMVQAVIKDDPDAEAIRESLTQAITEMKEGKKARVTKVEVSAIVETRNLAGLSQNGFAKKLGISVNTLKSWEQGKRKPSSMAQTFLNLLHKHPELIDEV